MHRFYLFLCTGLLFLVSCRHDPDLSNVPTVHFTEIQAIMSGNCSMSGCHDGDGQFALITYDDVMSIVHAGDAYKSKLYRSITGKGENKMPPASNPSLTSKQIQEVYVWIEQGALNN